MPDMDLVDLGPLMLGGAPASAALRELEPLAARLIAHFADTNPIFARFEMADVQEDLVAVIAVGLRLATRLMDERRVPVDSDLDCIRALTVKQALKGVPLDAILKLAFPPFGGHPVRENVHHGK